VVALLVVLGTLVPPQSKGEWPTLAAELTEHQVPLPAGVDGSRRITSFSEFDDDNWFAIGYYDVRADDTLRTLIVRAFDRRSGTWRSATFAEIGSVLALTHHGRLFYLRGHSSPSSSPLLVLHEDLTLKRELEGWEVWSLADGRVIFQRGMVHFAPAHAGVLAIYDPRTNRDVSVYPAGRHNHRGVEEIPGTDLFMDRGIGEAKAGTRPHTIVFPVTKQPIRIDEQQQGHPAGPEKHVLVTCDLTPRIPACRERPAPGSERR
jgi:hypothetical protein